jgi:cobalamin biosynthesis Co2+ chelatase CbiK
MSGYSKFTDLFEKLNVVGLNIEGHRPTLTLPKGCKWYNLIQVIDEPLKGINFDSVMKSVNENKYQYIEETIDININSFIHDLSTLILKIKLKEHLKEEDILVHVHQYIGTTILDKTLKERTGLNVILDTTNFFETPINYNKEYPDIKVLISISQCAGMSDYKAGQWIIPTDFMEYDVKNDVIFTDRIVV